jgi:hypothetical protein
VGKLDRREDEEHAMKPGDVFWFDSETFGEFMFDRYSRRRDDYVTVNNKGWLLIVGIDYKARVGDLRSDEYIIFLYDSILFEERHRDLVSYLHEEP